MTYAHVQAILASEFLPFETTEDVFTEIQRELPPLPSLTFCPITADVMSALAVDYWPSVTFLSVIAEA
jgi:hypothetical protein